MFGKCSSASMYVQELQHCQNIMSYPMIDLWLLTHSIDAIHAYMLLLFCRK